MKIEESLRFKYLGTSKYLVENVYLFRYDWETDFLAVKTNGYTYEIEIKVSRSDFLADFKKIDKHNVLSGKTNRKFKPNKFFYICPTGIITAKDLPPYAGLMYIDYYSQITTVKEAPFLHKEILEVEKPLAMKFYMRWRKEVAQRKRIENKL